MNIFYRGILNLFSIVYPVKIYGKENVPKGRAVFICNHFRAIDCAYVAKVYSKDIKFLAKKELFKNKLLAKTIKSIGAIPVDRENPEMSTVLQVFKYLKAEHKVCIFPEGTRNKTNTNEIQEMKNGYILFALKTSSPIIPIMMLNKGKAFRRTKIIVGKPIYFDEYFGKKVDEEKMEELSKIVRETMIKEQMILSDITHKRKKKC